MCDVVQNFTKWFMILAQNFLLKWNNSSLDTNIHVSLRLCYLKWLTAGWILFLGCLQLQAASWVHNFCDLLSVCLSARGPWLKLWPFSFLAAYSITIQCGSSSWVLWLVQMSDMRQRGNHMVTNLVIYLKGSVWLPNAYSKTR